MFRLKKTIDHHFPDLYQKIEAIPECRKHADYSLLELIMAGIAIFLFKKGSRNAMNTERVSAHQDISILKTLDMNLFSHYGRS